MSEKSKITKYFKASKRSKLSTPTSTTDQNAPEEVVDNELQEEVKKLKEQLETLKLEKQDVMVKVYDAKNEVEAKQKHEEQLKAEAARLASLTPIEARIEQLDSFRKLFRTFGVEINSSVRQGISATFHHWYKGVRVDTNSVALVDQGEGRIVVQKHSLPPNAVAWMKKVPCVAPHASFEDTLQDIRLSCSSWNNRYHQLEEFKVAYSEVKVCNSLDLASVILKAELKEGHGIEHIKRNFFLFSLTYETCSIRPYKVELDFSGEKDKGKEELEELEEILQDIKTDIPIFKQMAIKDAFCFMFEENEDATRRSVYIKSE